MYHHDESGAAFAQQRAEEAEALHQNATELMMEYRLLWQQERTKTTRLRAERDAARAAAAAWKRSAKMWRRYACGVRYRREVPYYESVSARPYEPIGDAYVEAYLENVSTARRAVAAHIKEAGKWKTNCSGVIRCPICDNGKLEWGYAGRYNGHIGGECSTNGCVNWQE